MLVWLIFYIPAILFAIFFLSPLFDYSIGIKEDLTEKREKPFEPYITDAEQNLFVSRFKSFSFNERPQFMYGLRNIPPRNVQMQFSHQSKCYIDVTKDINKRCFKYEVKYKKTVIKTFYDWGGVGDYCWNLHISYRENPELVIKRLKTEKREALAAGDFD